MPIRFQQWRTYDHFDCWLLQTSAANEAQDLWKYISLSQSALPKIGDSVSKLKIRAEGIEGEKVWAWGQGTELVGSGKAVLTVVIVERRQCEKSEYNI